MKICNIVCANGYAERKATKAMLKDTRRVLAPQTVMTVGADKGYAISQHKRKLIEQGFGWAKSVGRIRPVMVRGLAKVDQFFVLNMAAYNLVRMRTLAAVRPIVPA